MIWPSYDLDFNALVRRTIGVVLNPDIAPRVQAVYSLDLVLSTKLILSPDLNLMNILRGLVMLSQVLVLLRLFSVLKH